MSRQAGGDSRSRLRRELERARRTGSKPSGTRKDARPRLEPGSTLAEAIVEDRGPR